MAKIIGHGPLPKKIPGFVHYSLPDVSERILRGESGISKENYKQKRYQKSHENACEFGRVAALCKKFRQPLNGVFPVSNRNALCNRFTSKMRSLLQFDTVSKNGSRNLGVAFSLVETRQELVGFDFNLISPLPYLSRPFITFDSSGAVTLNACLFVSELTFPSGADWVAVRVHYYLFDFNVESGVLYSNEYLFLNRFTSLKFVELSYGFLTVEHGVLFTFLELKFYNFEEGSYIPTVPDFGTVVFVLGCEE
jgi:hypothetical protein